jgi:RNA polymerase sigma-70 factor, ECF subfamily
MTDLDSATPVRNQVTRLLVDWSQGKKEALDALTPLVYGELRKLAAGYLSGERHAATLQPTALVNEAYIRLVAQDLPDWNSRAHFFGVAAHLMRQILVDHARKHRSQKRGGGAAKAELNEALHLSPQPDSSILALDDALKALAEIDPRKAKVIELRYFGGLSHQETADALGISLATVGREQRLAEAWLHKEMKADSKSAGA